MSLFPRRRIPQDTHIEIDGRLVRVRIRVHQRARSYRLALPHDGEPVLTLPPNGRWTEAAGFLERQRDWLAPRLSARPAPLVLAAGARIPLRGVPHLIVPTGELRGRVEPVEDDGRPALRVPGDPAHLARRLADWLKAEAGADLRARTGVHAATLGVGVTRISLRGQSTRWGSCSSGGALSYNWRLIGAPPFVLDYVAAHEVAHRVEMNHSPAFWSVLARALPDYGRGRDWLKTHGAQLMTLGRSGQE